MGGDVQFGVLAACIVLFVPMGMAGWHLSRNKMLFFSGALFITLAVGIVWDVKPVGVGEALMNNFSHEVSWAWSKSTPVIACGFQKLSHSDASDLLNGSWIVVAGDSQARLVVLSLLNLICHSDYRAVIDKIGLKLDFVWAPYNGNLTNLLLDFEGKKRYPDVLVMGSGLWHMLHVTEALAYEVSLMPIAPEYGNDGSVTGSISIRSPHMFWLGMPTLVNSMLHTEEKRLKMNNVIRNAYDRELYEKIVGPCVQLMGCIMMKQFMKLQFTACSMRCLLNLISSFEGDDFHECYFSLLFWNYVGSNGAFSSALGLSPVLVGYLCSCVLGSKLRI
ncbi:hypothetical protein NE237_014176 [Protea cynaroides]|uniref:Uncharacterized protein n=1 Tax=Protea cynaroides TaxID=273540 RepID=A0A9Q0JTB1_9MAGN|nr:hypothetical protein NE237_014176 [Protea cynaroides]